MGAGRGARAGARLAGAHRRLLHRVEQVEDGLQQRVDLGHLGQHTGRRARDQELAAADRAVGVLGGEDGRPELVEPGEPEQVALGRPGRVVGQLVQRVVEDVERGREVGGQRGQVVRRRLQRLDGGQRGDREGPDLVADDRGALAQERARRGQRRAERARAGQQRLQRRAERVAQRGELAERDLGVGQRRRELRERGLDVLVLGGEGAEDRVGGVDELGELGVLVAQRVGQQLEVVDGATDVDSPLLELAGDLGQVAAGGREAAQRAREVGGVVAQALAGAAEQHPQVGAGVGVQRREDLVDVDVGQRLVDRDRRPVLELLARGRVARVHRDDHVLQAGLGPQEHGRVRVDRVVLLADVHGHQRAPVLQLHVLDLAHRDAGDVHRLALARGDGLRGGELRLEGEEVLAQDRDPPRQVEALLGQDVAAHEQSDEDEHDDRDELACVLADRVHGVVS